MTGIFQDVNLFSCDASSGRQTSGRVFRHPTDKQSEIVQAEWLALVSLWAS